MTQCTDSTIFDPPHDAKEYVEECVAEKKKQERGSVALQERLERLYAEEIEKWVAAGKKGKEEEGGKAVGKAEGKALLAPHLHSHSHLGELMDGEMSGGVDLGC